MKTKKLLAIVMTVTVVFSAFCGLIPVQASQTEAVTYVDASKIQQTANCSVIESTQSALTLTDGWYVVKGKINVAGKITVSGNVSLVLEDISQLYAESGIALSEGNGTKLAIFGQTDGSGDIIATGTSGKSGIACTDAVLEVNGGNIIATGGKNSAGIGGSYSKDMGTVVINGGKITATGGQYGAGIGGGTYANGGTITVNRGIIDATGGLYGAGIGGGNYGKGSDITVNLGIVIATGGKNASGIGGGNFGEGGNVTVTGGIVKAYSEMFSETNIHHIGGGIYAAETPGTKNFTGGVVCEGENVTWYSDTVYIADKYDLDKGYKFTVPQGKTLEIMEGASVHNGGTFINEGILINRGGFYNYGTYTNNGVLRCFPTACAHPEKGSDGAHCKQCNIGDKVFKDDGIYQVSNASELVWMADNAPNLNETPLRIELTDDITITDEAGWNAFDSTYAVDFNGNGKTIYIEKTNWKSHSANAGLFKSLNNSVVRNLVIEGSIEHTPSYSLGALTGIMTNSTIENVVSGLSIKAEKQIDHSLSIGGLVGMADGSGNVIRNCAVYGDMVFNVMVDIGCMVGEIRGELLMENSVCRMNRVKYTGISIGIAEPEVGYIAGKISSSGNATLKNIWYAPPTNQDAKLNDAVVSGQATTENVDRISESILRSPELVWRLNNGVTDGSQAWYYQSVPMHHGATVYKGYINCHSSSTEGYSTTTALYPEKPDHTWDNPCDTRCNVCQETRVTSGHSYKNNLCTLCLEGQFEIYNADDLLWFSEFVNSGNYDADAIVMADIDLDGKTFSAIAPTELDSYDNHGYTGTFSGNGHIIKNISPEVPDESKSVGLFGTLGGTVTKLGIENINFVSTSNYYNLGGIAGQVTTEGKIKDCYVANSSLRAAPSAGGIAGLNEGTIESCHSYNLTLGGSLNRYGGICGDWPNGKVINSYTDYVQLGSTAAGKEGLWDSMSEKAVSHQRFESGEITWFLNNKTNDGSFRQKKAIPSYPAFNGFSVVNDGSSFKILYTDFEVVSYDDVKKEITAIIPSAGTYTLIVADYSGSELINIKEIPLTITDSTSGRQNILLDNTIEISAGDAIMLWENTSDDTTPLCRSYRVK